MKLSKEQIKQIIKEELNNVIESKALEKYNNMPADEKSELIDTMNDLLSANKSPEDWLEALMIAVEIAPRRIGFKPTDVEIKGDTLFLRYKENQKRSFNLMKRFLRFRQMPPSSSMMAKASGLVHIETLPTETDPFFTLEIKK
jgi:hypothetical protein